MCYTFRIGTSLHRSSEGGQKMGKHDTGLVTFDEMSNMLFV
jgi:hypothetical protein